MLKLFTGLFPLFLVLFSSYGIACYSKQEVSYVFGGTVINSKKVIVPNARIVARIIEEDPNQAAKKFVTYTGARGKWQLKIPPAKTIKIKVFSNGYKALEKNIVIKEWLATKRKINFILFQDLEDICWGSLNYLQLYVNPLHQKNIEKYIQTGKMKKADRYLENVIKPIKRPYAYNFAGYIAFVHAKLEESKKYFTLGGSKLWFNLMGKSALKKKNYPQALLYYLQGVTEVNKARSLLLLAKKFDQLGHVIRQALPNMIHF